MQLFGNRGITGEPPGNQSQMSVTLVLGKEVTFSSSFVQSVSFGKKDISTAQGGTVVDFK